MKEDVFLIGNKIITKRSYPYNEKENYVTPHSYTDWWREHLNFQVIHSTISAMGNSVADFGCNHGVCSILMCEYGVEVTGFDRNREALKEAERIKAECTEGVRDNLYFKHSEFDKKIDCEDNYFTGAYMIDAFEHLYPEDRGIFFSEVIRVMKNHGKFCVVVPYEHAYDNGDQHIDFFNESKLNDVFKDKFKVNSISRDQRVDAHGEKHNRINAIFEVVK